MAAFESIEPVVRISSVLKQRYGSRYRYRYLNFRPATLYIGGDDISFVDELKKQIKQHFPPRDIARD